MGPEGFLSPQAEGLGALVPTLGCFLGGSPDPSLEPSTPSRWECGFQQKSWKKDSTDPLWGTPNLDQGLGVFDVHSTQARPLC